MQQMFLQVEQKIHLEILFVSFLRKVSTWLKLLIIDYKLFTI